MPSLVANPIARTHRPRMLFGAAVLAGLMSASCVESAPAGPTPTLIPSDAIGAVIVESPYKLFAAAQDFWKAAGLDRSTGSDLQGLMEKSIPQSSEAQQTLDFARPWAFAVLPSPGPKKTREALYIPFKSKPDALIGKLFGSGTMRIVAEAKGYVVLADADGDFAFPPAKGADLSRLSRYPASAIKLWGDPAAIRRATVDGYKPIAEAIREFVTPPAPADAQTPRDPKAAAKALGEFGLSILAQLGLADAAVELGATGLILRAGVAARLGSDLQKALAAASFAPPALDWAGQLPADVLYGYAWSMDPAIASGLGAQLMEPMLSGLGMGKELSSRAMAMQAKWSKAGGPRGVIGVDLDFDASALAGAKDLKSEDPAAISDFIKKLVRVRFDLLQDVKDEAAYRALIDGLATDPDYLAFTKAYAEALGISFAVRNQDKKDGAFSYGELGIDLKVVDSGKLGLSSGSSSSSAASEAAIAALGSLFSARWTIFKGRFVATGGDLATLKALAARKAADNSLAAVPTFAAFAATMPAKTFMVGSLSMRKVMGLATELMTASGSSAGQNLDPSQFGSWYSYFAIDARSLAPGLEAGLLVPAADVGALFRSAGSLFKPKPAATGT